MSSATQPAPPPPDAAGSTAELTPEEIVATPAVDGDLDQEMKRIAKPFGRLTLILAGVLVVALSFAGGAWTHAAFGSSSGGGAARAAAGGARGFGGGSGADSGPGAGTGTGAGGGRGAAGRGTVGTVEKVDGTTVTLKTAQGNDVKVSTSDSTTVGLTRPGRLGDLEPGATVTVQGRAGADGTVTAQTIVQQPAR
ncbi:DUF5666 domain-containing protein [Amycolatopsis sp. PS_44_ISF1]|uniref:DUF5666 domain-containing protein n=1 Tax=Amycolatopsis sp. PS_44_ISF1 TaxID=2974917 RepID=UPI0028DD7979|nr:DUF5666 domain-containing protein [Amycolatopsis sp. PS_44_ISF1]MDT8909897.1 DUF5666 domain-containing protein [Amycolatopsis sp. PS_44_ISF1]